jgi:hypothetical protein
MRRGEAYTRLGMGTLRERDHLEEPGIDGSIIIRWICWKWDEGRGLDPADSG